MCVESGEKSDARSSRGGGGCVLIRGSGIDEEDEGYEIEKDEAGVKCSGKDVT